MRNINDLNFNTPTVFICLALLMLSTACSPSKDVFLRQQLSRTHCFFEQSEPYSDGAVLHAPPTAQWEALRQILPERSAHAAVAADVVDEVIKLKALKEVFATDSTVNTRLDIMELRQSINDKVQNVSLEISAIAAQIDCEEERAEQVATYMKRKEDKRDKELTVAAIVVGAAGAITTGALLLQDNGSVDQNTVEVIGISVGITEAGLGTALLLNKKRTEYRHPKNHLACIWYPEMPCELMPPSVAYFLARSTDGKQSHIDRKRTEYQQFGPLAEAKKEKEKARLEALFFGEGGRYTAEQLVERANMLDQLEAMISLMKEELRTLMKLISTM